MKLFLAGLLVATTPAAWAGCNPNPDSEDKSCEEFGGQCSRAAALFLKGNAKAAPDVLKYGKFCGAANKCPGLNNPKKKPNVRGKDIDVESCDNILDDACKIHDACLDKAGGPGSKDVPIPDRCPCDLAFLEKITEVRVEKPDLGAPLCDEDFYNKQVIDLPPPVEDITITYAEFFAVESRPEPVILAAALCEPFLPANNDLNLPPGACVNVDLDTVYDGYNTSTGAPLENTLSGEARQCNEILGTIDRYVRDGFV